MMRPLALLLLVFACLNGHVAAVGSLRSGATAAVSAAAHFAKEAQILDLLAEVGSLTSTVATKTADLATSEAARDTAVASSATAVAAHAALAAKVTVGMQVLAVGAVVVGGMTGYQLYYFVPTDDWQVSGPSPRGMAPCLAC
jgi:hypothetical protein